MRKAEQKRRDNDFEYLLEHSEMDWKNTSDRRRYAVCFYYRGLSSVIVRREREMLFCNAGPFNLLGSVV